MAYPSLFGKRIFPKIQMRDFFSSHLFWGCFGWILLLSLFPTQAKAQNVTQGDWFIQQGQIVTVPTTFPSHGHATQYNYASIPPWPGPGWAAAPDLRVIAYFQNSRLCGGTYVCQRDLDFLYFVTELNVPANFTVNSFTVTSSQVDDGIRVTVFNSSNPNGLTLPNAYMYLGTNVTSSNLAAALKPGEINTMVLTVVDDCCQRVGPGNIFLNVNGTRINTYNNPPQITKLPATTATEDQVYSPSKVEATDRDTGDTLSYKLTKAPAGATINPATGEITWTPGDADAGKDVDFEVEVCDSATPPACKRAAWKVKVANINDPPTITSTAPTDAPSGKEMNYKPTVRDPDPSDTHTWKLTKAPVGATIDPVTGEIKWTPSASDVGKDVDFEIEVCDNATPPACAKQSFRVGVYAPCNLDADCPLQQICENGRCIDPGCATQSPQCASNTDVCLKGQCGADPCTNKTCANDETCRPSDGKCIKACAGVQCPTGQRCVDGACNADPCAQNGTTCNANEYCNTSGTTPTCTTNPCTASSCRHGRICQVTICVDDPCNKMTCPNAQTQRCEAGQCVDRLPCKVDLNCPSDQLCINQRCFPPGCHPLQPQCTPNTKLCIDGLCQDNTCDNKQCAQGEFCRPIDGKCAGSCSSLQCPAGQRCVDGACQADPCANQQCPAGQVCVAGTCEAEQCNASNVCKHGRLCRTDTNTCASDPCFNVTCPNAGEICKLGQCLPPPTCAFDKDCPTTNLCVNGKCVSSQCSSANPCPAGKRCSNGQCADDLCTNKQCPTDTFCNGGQCVSSCAGIFCPQGKLCSNGLCVDDPCANKQCPQGQICQSGLCVPNNCQSDSCKNGRQCLGDRCVDDPCHGLTCPNGQTCAQGQCAGDKTCKHDAECGSDGVCLQKLCAPQGCYPNNCPQGELCFAGKCIANPCANKQCATDEHCRPNDASCVKDCPKCPAGQRCLNGTCQADPCANIQCAQDEFCKEGQCVKDLCKLANTVLCRHQRLCTPAQCNDDPCLGVQCKAGQTCQEGRCTSTTSQENILEKTNEVTKEASPEVTSEITQETTNETSPEVTSEITQETTNETTQQETQTESIVQPDGSTGEKDTGERITGEPSNNDTAANIPIAGGGCSCNQHDPTFPISAMLGLLLLFYRRRSFSFGA